jgi:hypothetical protein
VLPQPLPKNGPNDATSGSAAKHSKTSHLAGAVAGAHGERHCRAASRAKGRNMIDGVVGRGDLLQGLTLVTLLAAQGLFDGPRRPCGTDN